MHQRIDGFGASSAWRSYWTDEQADLFFSTNTGIGLSLLRTRIAPGGTTVEQTIMQLAQARGARVWSAPWSPAPVEQFKSNSSLNGGNFIGNASNYQAYASQLARYVVNMKNEYGVNIYALSIQNEPDANVTTYESCKWTAQQIHDFVPYLSAALAASNVAATRIMLPESQNWTDPQALRLTTMNDATTAALVGIIANHNYVPDNTIGDQTIPAALNSFGKALWETEVSTFNPYDDSISNGIYWAKRIHWFLTAAQVNAWHYWWLIPFSSNNDGLTDAFGNPAKRFYALGQFSRFVRPNYYRIDTGTAPSSPFDRPVLVSAFKDLSSANFAIVAVNPYSNTNFTFNLTNFLVAGSVTPWITSSNLSLSPQTPVVVAGTSFTYLLPAQSVVTFVGQGNALSAPPVITAQPASQTVAAGSNGVFSVTAIGATPLSYQWHFNGTNDIVGATHSLLTVSNAQSASAGLYSVTVSNLFGSVLSSNAALRVNHPPVADASATLPLVVSANGSTAAVILDGARSSDPDSDLIYYAWYEAGAFLAAGAAAVELMPSGAHSLSLVVNDGMLADTNIVTVAVVTTAEAVNRLVAALSSEVSRVQPLAAALRAALAAIIDRRDPIPAINQLLAFQNQVRAQVEPLDPAVAASLIQSAQDIIDALSGGSNPGGHPHGRFTSVSRQSNGHVRMQFSAEATGAHLIEASANLVDWELIGVAAQRADGEFEFEDAQSGEFAQRFYRVRVQ